MQSIINNSGFGFCKASGFNHCNNCLHRLRCINYAPIYLSGVAQTRPQEVLNLQSSRTLSNSELNIDSSLAEENLALKQRIQDLEAQILLLNQSKNTKEVISSPATQKEETNSELQVYKNKNIEVYQQENDAPLKTKKGIFGTKYVEDKPKNK